MRKHCFLPNHAATFKQKYIKQAHCDMRHATSIHLVSPTRMHARKCVLVTTTSRRRGRPLFTSVGLRSGFSIFLLLHLLGGPVTLIVQLLVLLGDLGLAIFRFPTSTGAVSYY